MTGIAGPEIYSYEYYRRIAEIESDYWWHTGMREIQTALLAPSDAQRPRRALDAGCGTGGGMAWLRETCRAGWVTGIDISREALLFHPAADRRVAQASVLGLPFKPESFDLLICLDVVQHLPTDGADVSALKEMYRVLVPGGRLLVRANSRQGMLQHAKDRDVDFQRYLLPEVETACRAAGFVVERATYANALPAIYASLKRCGERAMERRRSVGDCAGMPKKLYEGLPLRNAGRLPGWVNWLLYQLMRGEAGYLRRPGRRLPFGHTTFCVGRKPVGTRSGEL
jgi:ubiquinone/menaquinone biosynthesis C-methylase UbiE